MHNEVKESLNAIFKQEQLGVKHVRKPKRKKTPLFVAIAATCIACLLVVSASLNDRRTTVEEQANNIFELKNTYIGSNIVSHDVASYVLADYQVNSFALHTTEQPYGMTILMDEEVPSYMQLKFAYYMFALVQNCSYVIVDVHGEEQRYDRQTFDVDFASIETEQQLLTVYFNTLLSFENIPKIEADEQHVYKTLFNAVNKGVGVTNDHLNVQPQYIVLLDDRQFSMWIDGNAVYLMDHDKPFELKEITGELYADIRNIIATSGDNTIKTGEQVIISNLEKVEAFEQLFAQVEWINNIKPELSRHEDVYLILQGETSKEYRIWYNNKFTMIIADEGMANLTMEQSTKLKQLFQ